MVSAGGLEGCDWRFACLWFSVWFGLCAVVSSCLCPGCSDVGFRFVGVDVGFRFVGVIVAALVLLAMRALPCVVLSCLEFVLCVPVGMSQ